MHSPLYEWAFGEKLPHPETSHRAGSILTAIERNTDAFFIESPKSVPWSRIRKTHDARLLNVYKAARSLDPDVTYAPSVFPKRHQARPNPFDIHHAGYFCFDAGTPLTARTWEAAGWSAGCAVAAADWLVASGGQPAYALCRPPGHHASRDLFGGYCYFNNAALAAARLRPHGRVALLDIDFHHGNGTQQIFYRDDRVLFVSLHGDPREFYPYFAGHADEIGAGAGAGFTVNEPLPSGCDGQEYLRVLESRVLPTLRRFDPAVLLVSAGFDTYRRDPLGGFELDTPDYYVIGERLGREGWPSLVVQEGGYHARDLGINVATFLFGLKDGRKLAKNPRSWPQAAPPDPKSSPTG